MIFFGWDHVGMNLQNLVYESHPGYMTAVYVSGDGTESASIQNINGVADPTYAVYIFT